MERELLQLFESAKKAADSASAEGVSSSGPEVSRCLDVLNQLTRFPVTYDVLISTQVGKRVRTFTKHRKEKIREVASALLEAWKGVVVGEAGKRAGEREEPEAASVSKNHPAPPPKLTSMIKCNDPSRDKIRDLLLKALSEVPADEEGAERWDPIRVAVAVESTMFEKLGRSNGAHKPKYRSILFNIKDPKNPDLKRKVLAGEVRPEELVCMTAEEMASAHRQQENRQIKEKALLECERGGPPKATTDQFRCGRCGQRKCTYHQMQTRSADEPMTTYVTCVNCNHHWKFC